MNRPWADPFIWLKVGLSMLKNEGQMCYNGDLQGPNCLHEIELVKILGNVTLKWLKTWNWRKKGKDALIATKQPPLRWKTN